MKSIWLRLLCAGLFGNLLFASQFPEYKVVQVSNDSEEQGNANEEQASDERNVVDEIASAFGALNDADL